MVNTSVSATKKNGGRREGAWMGDASMLNERNGEQQQQ
jgi:hypothetical protein